MKKRRYSEYNLKIIHWVAIASVFLFFLIDAVMLMEEVFDIRFLSLIIPKKESVILYLWLGRWLFLPIISGGCWYMYFERYICLKLSEEEKSAYCQERKRLLINIGAEVLAGMVAIVNLHSILMFLAEHWEYINELVAWAIIKSLFAVIWVYVWFWCLKRRKRGGDYQGKSICKAVGVMVLLILIGVLSIVVTAKVYEEAETVRFRKMLEYYDQYGEYKYS